MNIKAHANFYAWHLCTWTELWSTLWPLHMVGVASTNAGVQKVTWYHNYVTCRQEKACGSRHSLRSLMAWTFTTTSCLMWWWQTKDSLLENSLKRIMRAWRFYCANNAQSQCCMVNSLGTCGLSVLVIGDAQGQLYQHFTSWLLTQLNILVCNNTLYTMALGVLSGDRLCET